MDPTLDGPKRVFNLLSLDGGGVKGISSLMILDAILIRVKEIEQKSDPKSERYPTDYFDLAGGTSTGGLAALMMFRLGLSTYDTMNNYDVMSQQIFGGSLDNFGLVGHWVDKAVQGVKAVFSPARFSAVPLEKSIDKVVKNSGIAAGGQAPLLDDKRPKMLMCSTLAEKGETILFRSYTQPADGAPVTHGLDDFSDVKIQDAARATSAAPTYLPEAIIKGSKFWDGGLLNNNPVNQVWDARYDLDDTTTHTPVVSCVLSIGTSWSKSKPISSKAFSFLNVISETISFSTNTEAKHRDFLRQIGRINRRLPEEEQTAYFRFNVQTKDPIDLDDWKSMEKLKGYTRDYLLDDDVKKEIEKCAQVLARRPGKL